MKNYRNSDYALNKFSQGIVYKFSDSIVEVTLEDYLRTNPGKTEQDFMALKALSDEIYLEQDRADNAQTRKNVSLHGMEDSLDIKSIPLDEQYIAIQNKRYANEAITKLLRSNALTDTQRRRFVLHILRGLSLREIAAREKVHFTSVNESIASAVDKLKKISGKF